MAIVRHNYTYSGGWPVAIGDRYYAQDLFRDFNYVLEKAGLAIDDILTEIPMLVFGGYVTKGTGWDKIDIAPAIGYHEYDVTSPNNWAAIPPTTKTDTLRAQRVESGQYTDYDLSSATLDGVTTNYLTLQHGTISTNQRDRVKAAGSYFCEIVDTDAIFVGTTPPTSKQVLLATLVGDGSSFLTITNIEPVNLKKLNLNEVFQDDSRVGIVQPEGTTLFEFGSRNLADSAGNLPIAFTNQTYIPYTDTTNVKFAWRGCYYNNSGYIDYAYSWGNAGSIRMRIKPDWAYDTSDNKYIISSESGGSLDDSVIFVYDQGSDKLIFSVYDDGTNLITCSTAAFASNPALQQWFDIVLTWDKANNDDADSKGNAEFYLDGVAQNKVKTGNGIVAMNMTKTILTFMNVYRTALDHTVPAEAFFTDVLFGNVWNEDTTNHDGGDDVLPYYNDNRIALINHTGQLDNKGNAAFNAICIKDLFFTDSDIFGYPKFKSGFESEEQIEYIARKNPTAISAAPGTENGLFDALAPYIPNNGDTISISGLYNDGGGAATVYAASRNSSTRIYLRSGIGAPGYAVDDGDATAVSWDIII